MRQDFGQFEQLMNVNCVRIANLMNGNDFWEIHIQQAGTGIFS